MSRHEQSSTPAATHGTEVYVDGAVRGVLDREAKRLGVTVSEYVRDAVLARATFALGARGEDLCDLVAGWARTLLDEEAEDGGRRADQQRLIAALAGLDPREVCDEAAALRAESRQARRRAGEVRDHGNVILDTVALMVTDVLRRQGFALLTPVVATFRMAENGSSGVQIVVRLKDPRHANAAKAAIGERFPDRLSDVV